MSQPILSIKSDDNNAKAVANLLPCRVHHDGPVPSASTYWTPTNAEGVYLPLAELDELWTYKLS